MGLWWQDTPGQPHGMAVAAAARFIKECGAILGQPVAGGLHLRRYAHKALAGLRNRRAAAGSGVQSRAAAGCRLRFQLTHPEGVVVAAKFCGKLPTALQLPVLAAAEARASRRWAADPV